MQSPWTFKGDGSDSYELPISEVKVGDHVLNVDKTKSNEVVFVEKQEFEGSIYSPDSDQCETICNIKSHVVQRW